jgi:GNAT superfamily N-acetyltransferase
MMRARKVVTYLKMTARAHLVPGNEPPRALELVRTRDQAVIRPVYEPIAQELEWSSWDDWESGFHKLGRHYFVIRIDSLDAGLAKLIDHGEGDIEVDTFGLIPEFVGKGFGGAALTEVLKVAWDLAEQGGKKAVVWLHTSTNDHPNALRNYQARGMLITEVQD